MNRLSSSQHFGWDFYQENKQKNSTHIYVSCIVHSRSLSSNRRPCLKLLLIVHTNKKENARMKILRNSLRINFAVTMDTVSLFSGTNKANLTSYNNKTIQNFRIFFKRQTINKLNLNLDRICYHSIRHLQCTESQICVSAKIWASRPQVNTLFSARKVQTESPGVVSSI